jgi:predicted nucleotide-binding protein
VTYYHVWITLRSHQWPGVGKLDLSREELEIRVVRPYRESGSINLTGRRMPMDDIERIQIRRTEESADQIKPRAAAKKRALGVPLAYAIFSEGKDVTDEVLEPLPLPQSEAPAAALPKLTQTLLQTIWEFFTTNNRWPSTRELDISISRVLKVELAEATVDLPTGLVWPDLSQFRLGSLPDQQEVRLTVRGLSCVPGTEDDLKVLVAVIGEVARQAADYEPQSADDYLVVTSAGLADRLGLAADSPSVRMAFDLIVGGLSGLWRGGGTNPDGWSFTVNERGARRYLGVTTITDLLRRMEQVAQAQRADMARLTGSLPPELQVPEATEIPGPAHGEEEGNPREVFVVHGRNQKANTALKAFLTAIGLHMVDFEFDAIAATGVGSPYTGEILTAGFRLARAVIIFLTPDERVQLRREHAGSPSELRAEYQARPNVFFEAGMAFLSHPRRTVIVELGNIRPFSDIGGRHTIRLDDSTDARERLISRLRVAGCSVDVKDDRWIAAGRFMDAVAFPTASASGGRTSRRRERSD